jgi:hypothetical protein
MNRSSGDASGRTAPAMMAIYLIILAWAVLAWIR